MKTLILPAAGGSSRFPGMRPKWLLTMPDGKLMIEKSVELLNLDDFQKVIIVCLREHVEKYLSKDFFDDMRRNFNHKNLKFFILDEPTKSQSETVAKALVAEKVEGAFLIKDCDNIFSFEWNGFNQIAVVDLGDVDKINAKNKSYVSVDQLGVVNNIVEKEIISDKFCCGAYGFESAEIFLKTYESIKQDGETYISHVIFAMMMGGESFRIGRASDYIDWGTAKEYKEFQKSFVTVFCDVDGVLLKNGSKFGPVKWETDAIASNVQHLADLQKKGSIYLVITSSRPESQESYIREKLLKLNLVPDKFLLGLPHGRRLLINDYSLTNSYPSAVAINLERDSDNLKMLIDSIFN